MHVILHNKNESLRHYLDVRPKSLIEQDDLWSSFSKIGRRAIFFSVEYSKTNESPYNSPSFAFAFAFSSSRFFM